jgi:hypothetical protein
VKVTGETITDAQIRWLRERTGWRGHAQQDQHTIALALSTPKWMNFDARKREEARAQCAEMFNARNADIPDLFGDLFPGKGK